MWAGLKPGEAQGSDGLDSIPPLDLTSPPRSEDDPEDMRKEESWEAWEK